MYLDNLVIGVFYNLMEKKNQDAQYARTKIMRPRSNRVQSFGSYCKEVFKTSLITSFPEIATSKSCTKRLIKMLVFVACTIGFSFQTLAFLKMYLAYQTIVDVDITDPFMVEQPGITVCNFNRKRRTFICAENNRCTSFPPEKFCESRPMQCPWNAASKAFPFVPHLSELIEDEFYWEKEREETHNDSMFRRCYKRVDGNVDILCKEPYLAVPVINENGEPNYCYSIESQYGKPDAQPDKYANFFSIEVILDTQPEEYVDFIIPIRMQLALHDRKARINPFEPLKGYTLKGGIIYVAYISMVTKQRLPYPYDTNCTDYLEKWRENNGTGPLNQNMCVEQCKLNKLLELDLCVERTVFYLHEEQLCKRSDPHTSITESMLKECYSECGYACSELSYEAQFQEVGNYDNVCMPDVWCKHKLIRIAFDFTKFRHTNYISKPKFESVELFSYLGGYMGMWLGVSFITLFDLFETLCYLLFWPIDRALHKKSRVNRLPATRQQGKNSYNDQIVVY